MTERQTAISVANEIETLKAQRDELLAACEAFPVPPVEIMGCSSLGECRDTIANWLEKVAAWFEDVCDPAIAKAKEQV
jgi:hypothetical protein